MTWTILDTAVGELDRALTQPAPEQGGALLGHADLPHTIVRFVHDPDAKTSSVSYECSDSLAEVVRELERTTGYRLAGIAHSHPGAFDEPSAQDHRAFRQTLALNPWKGVILVPITTQRPATRDHDTGTAHGKISWFEARPASDGIEVRPAVVRVLPVGRDLRNLNIDAGITFGEPRFEAVDGVGYVAVSADHDWVEHVLFPTSYPWQAPIALVPSDAAGEHNPVTVPWDLSAPEADRLAYGWQKLMDTRSTMAHSTATADEVEARLAGILSPLADTSVLVFGAGSLGSYIAEVLARHGVGRLTLVDPDTVSPPNLTRSMYEWADIDSPKVHALAARIRRIRPDVKVDTVQTDVAGLGAAKLGELIEEHMLVVGAIDDMTAQATLNAFAWKAGKPAVYPAVYREARAGEVVLAVPLGDSRCWRCAVLGSAAATDDERPHDYGTGRIAAACALGADVWSIANPAAKLALALLHLYSGGDGDLADLVTTPISRHTTLAQFGNSPGWFGEWLAGAHGQWAYQSLWATVVGDPDCPVCGSEPTAPHIDTVLTEAQRDDLLSQFVGKRRWSDVNLIAKSLLSLLAVGGIVVCQKAVLDHTGDRDPARVAAAQVQAVAGTDETNSTGLPPRPVVTTTAVVDLPPFDPVNRFYGLMPVAAKDPIAYGATGDTVAYIQAVLRFAAGQPIEIDGIFGPDTADAVYNLQRFWGLPVDGTVQDEDWGVIDFLASR